MLAHRFSSIANRFTSKVSKLPRFSRYSLSTAAYNPNLVRNVAIIAHVDHGDRKFVQKTVLSNAYILCQCR